MTTIASNAVDVVTTSPLYHTVLNNLVLQGDSVESLIGDAILFISSTLGTHSITLKNDGIMEVVG
jgi:hypothetical protein